MCLLGILLLCVDVGLGCVVVCVVLVVVGYGFCINDVFCRVVWCNVFGWGFVWYCCGIYCFL